MKFNIDEIQLQLDASCVFTTHYQQQCTNMPYFSDGWGFPQPGDNILQHSTTYGVSTRLLLLTAMHVCIHQSGIWQLDKINVPARDLAAVQMY